MMGDLAIQMGAAIVALFLVLGLEWVLFAVARHVVSKLLHIANSEPVNRDAFYALKKRLLERYGDNIGIDLQHIPGKPCWTCNGSGIYRGWHLYSGDEWEDVCNRCGGSGQYKREFWVVLSKYKFGRFTFHIPGERIYEAPQVLKTGVDAIEGYIEHAHYGDGPEVAYVWLCLLCREWEMLRWWFAQNHTAIKWWRWHPFFWIRNVLVWWRLNWKRSDCRQCGKTVRGIYTQCEDCKEVPF